MTLALSIPQILIILIAIWFLFSAITKFLKRERSQTIFKLFSAFVIWGTVLLFAVIPNSSHLLTEKMGFGENLNTLIFFGFIIIFIILTKLISIIERIERNISEIVRKEALEKVTDQKSHE